MLSRTERKAADDGTMADLEAQDQGLCHEAGDLGAELLRELHCSAGPLVCWDNYTHKRPSIFM